MKKSNSQKDNQELYLCIFSSLSFIVALISILIHLVENKGLGFADHQWLWAECACTLKGIDSAEAIRQGIQVQGIMLPASTSTFPWTKILGVLIHGSFLPYDISCIYYVILNTVILTTMIVLVYRYMREYSESNKVATASILLMLSSWYLADLVTANNNATMICALIIIAIVIEDEHEVLSGVLIAFAMIKAQIVLPFCLVWLLKKKWKLLVTAAGIDIVCWLTSVVVTGVSPIRQLSNIVNMRVEMTEGYLVYGIFDGLRSFGVSSTMVLALSMFLGCILLVLVFCLTDRVLPKELKWFRWSLPAMVSVFWCYKSQCDYNILMIVALMLVELWCTNKESRTIVIVVIIEVLMLMKPISAVSAGLDWMGVINRDEAYYMVNRIDLYIKCISYFLAYLFGLRVYCRRDKD